MTLAENYDDEDYAAAHLEWESGREMEPLICGMPLSWWDKQPTEVLDTAIDAKLKLARERLAQLEEVSKICH